jgi:hypothetical protein
MPVFHTRGNEAGLQPRTQEPFSILPGFAQHDIQNTGDWSSEVQ